MWSVTNGTHYAAERSWVQDRDANRIWLVVVKATFQILADGSTQLADQQVPVLRLPMHDGEAGASSLIYEADLLGLKPCTDVLVRGQAWSPGGRRTSSVDVRVTVGPITKQLRVFGDRVWDRNLVGAMTVSPAQPFDCMPINYERAYGGWDRSSPDPLDHRLEPRNPIGTGFILRAEHAVGIRLPNVEYPDSQINSWKDRPMPAGLNAIECHWNPRRQLAGTYDQTWLDERFPLWAENFDLRYNNCSPFDQQVDGFLRGGEPVELLNLSPHGPISFHLPRVYPFFETRFGRERVAHRAQLATVILEPDYPRVIMGWQTSLICNGRADDLDTTRIFEKRHM